MKVRGFTVFEVMLVVGIVAILGSTGLIFAGREIGNARVDRARGDSLALEQGIWGMGGNGYLGDMGALPDAPGRLISPAVGPGGAPRSRNFRGESYGWSGPYVGYNAESVARDPWYRPWVYNPASGQVRSYGTDGVLRTTVFDPPDDLEPPEGVPSSPTGTLAVSVVDPWGIRMQRDWVRVWVMKRVNGEAQWETPLAGAATDELFRVEGLVQGRYPVRVAGMEQADSPVEPRCTGVDQCRRARLAGYAVAWVGGGALSSVEVRLAWPDWPAN